MRGGGGGGGARLASGPSKNQLTVQHFRLEPLFGSVGGGLHKCLASSSRLAHQLSGLICANSG
jgi:hypothetical protein